MDCSSWLFRDEYLKKRLTQRRQTKNDIAKTVQVNMVMGAIAGTVAAVVTTPVSGN